MKTCPNCGERVYRLGCTNCDEKAYIEDQEIRTEAMTQNCPWCGYGTWNGQACVTCGATEGYRKMFREGRDD